MNSSPFRALIPALTLAALSTPALATPPASPVITSGTWNSSNSLTLNWQDTSTDEDGFIFAYRVGTSGNFTPYGDDIAKNKVTKSFTIDASFRLCDYVFQWVVVSYKVVGTGREYGLSGTIDLMPPPPVGTTQCPPILRTGTYLSGMVNAPLSQQLDIVRRNTTTGVPIVLTSGITGTGLPSGLALTPAGLITWTPTAVGRYSFPLSAQEGGSPVLTKTMKITVFRPVPALVAPVNSTPLTNRTLRKGGAPLQIDLSNHFSDPDVTQASRIVFNTGTMDFVYYPSAAPATVTNFLGYISRGDYTNSIIHRSIPGFVLQGGGYKAVAGATSVPRQPAVVNEPEISNTRGTVAMAKLGTDPNSATSEYFISLGDNASNLNNQNEGFTVFARVAGNGMAVADGIAALTTKDFSTTNSALPDCPVTNPPPAAFDTASLVKVVSAAPVNPLSFTAQSSAPAICEVAVAGSQLTLTSHAPGTAVISVTATDLDNQPLPGTFNVTVNEPLSDWLTAQNFPVPADAAALSNPDGDAAVNIMEYALMTNPQSPSPAPLPQSGVTTVGASKYLTLAFPVRKYTSDAFAYAVEAGNGLEGGWTPVWTSAQGFAHAQVVSFTDQPDRTNVTIRDTAAITAGGKRFLRLRVTDTPQ
ncbi:MAG TPA: peptidylprolyl isomerase [Verrucomicrobiales bacterium]|nr:peptidylprolyl isomerase [Verrucomicrobiales bacterium]